MSTVKMLFFALLLVFTTACSTVKTDEWFVSHNGNMPTEERISQISKGYSQDKVLDILVLKCLFSRLVFRGVAQFGRVHGLGP